GDRRRDRVALGLGEHDGRQLDDAALDDAPHMELLRERRWRRLAEVRRHRLLQCRPLAAAVLAAGRGGDRLDADVVATAPVARDPAERREASLPSVRGDADAVDARAADDADPPAARGAGAEDGEGIVADADPGREAA